MRMFNVGDRVAQPNYGAGTITSANDRHTVIDFDEHGIRTFVTQMVTLERTTEPAPAKSKGGSRRSSSRKKTKS